MTVMKKGGGAASPEKLSAAVVNDQRESQQYTKARASARGRGKSECPKRERHQRRDVRGRDSVGDVGQPEGWFRPAAASGEPKLAPCAISRETERPSPELQLHSVPVRCTLRDVGEIQNGNSWKLRLASKYCHCAEHHVR
jgi:hypothetical protein